ncbi:hypothetical protein D9619_008297 [Psilocybe cf. subviscida]|uniref:Uncharacterized protein n=1 Tax=Psilocybe cf. subviscida TaxID=2480587 RepID=A0A8H5BA69_9AGAR|nr:hypothetical protein D9619_008297 [Psilocybe cf. subviscida]
MSQKTTTSFNAATKQQALLELDQYAASSAYSGLHDWDTTRKDSLLVVKGSVTRTEPVESVFVGMVGSDRQQLGRQGNFNTKYPDNLPKAKFQLIVTQPQRVELFDRDYLKAISSLEAAMNTVAKTSKREHFILPGNWISLNFPLFEERTPESDADQDVVDATAGYSVASEYANFWDTAKEKFHCRILDVFDINDERIDPKDFAHKLRAGTLVEVSFHLYHYPIGKQDAWTSDTFSAHLTQISILKEAPPVVASPYKKAARRPPYTPQSPSTRREMSVSSQVFLSKGAGKRRHDEVDTEGGTKLNEPVKKIAHTDSEIDDDE